MDTWAHPSLQRIMCARQGYRAGFGGPTDCGGPFLFLNSTFRPSSCPSALNAPHSHSGSSCPFSFKGCSSTQTDSHAELAWKKGRLIHRPKTQNCRKESEMERTPQYYSLHSSVTLRMTFPNHSPLETSRQMLLGQLFQRFTHFFYGFSSNVVCMQAKHCLSGCC